MMVNLYCDAVLHTFGGNLILVWRWNSMWVCWWLGGVTKALLMKFTCDNYLLVWWWIIYAHTHAHTHTNVYRQRSLVNNVSVQQTLGSFKTVYSFQYDTIHLHQNLTQIWLQCHTFLVKLHPLKLVFLIIVARWVEYNCSIKIPAPRKVVKKGWVMVGVEGVGGRVKR